MGKCFFNTLATFAESEVDLLRMRTREGMAIARAKGRLKGKAPKLSPTQRAVLLKLHAAGDHSIAELAKLSPSAARRSTANSRAYPRQALRRTFSDPSISGRPGVRCGLQIRCVAVTHRGGGDRSG